MSNKKKGTRELRIQTAEQKREDRSYLMSLLKIVPFAIYVTMIPLYKYQIEYVWSKIAWGYVSMALFGVIISFIYWKENRIFFNVPITLVLVLALVIYGSLSALWALNPYKVQNLAVMIGPGVLAYLASQTLNLWEIRIISVFVALASSVVSGYGLLQLLGVYPMPPDQYGNPNPITTFGLSNFAVEYLLLAFPLVLSLAIAERSMIRYLFIASAVINFLYIFGAKNRAGWVGLAVILSMFFLIYFLQRMKEGENPRRVLKVASVSLLAFTFVFFLFLNFTSYGRRVADRLRSFVQIGPGSSVTTRLLAWNASYEMMKDRPIFGVGAGNYEIFSWKYAHRLLDEATMHTNTRVDKAHNEYVQIMADLGVLGFAMFTAMVLLMIHIYLRIFSKSAENETKYHFWIATGLMGGIVGTLAGASFNFSLQWPGSVTHFWLFVGLLEVVRAETEKAGFFEIRTRRKFLLLLPGLMFLVASMGAPCRDGIPPCRSEICIRRALCRSLPGFFSARNFALAEVYYRYGQFYKRARNFSVSERFYLASLKHENPAERTYYDLAYLYLAASGGIIEQKVLNLLEETLKLVPYFGKGRRELGKMYIQIGQVDKGIEYVLRSTDSNPANIPEAYATAANAYLMKEDYESAIYYAQQALVELDNSPYEKRYGISIPEVIFNKADVVFLSYFVLGTAYVAKKDYQRAEEYLRLAHSMRPDNARVIVNLATSYINQGKLDEAENLMNSFEPKDDREKVARLFNLASIYAARGEKQKALEFLHAASSVNPDIINQALQDKYLRKYIVGNRE